MLMFDKWEVYQNGQLQFDFFATYISTLLRTSARFATISPMSEKTVLFFHSASWNHDTLKFDGLSDAATRLGWRVQLIHQMDISESFLHEILTYWHPLGCIVNCGNRPVLPPPEHFGKTPVVYLDCRADAFGSHANTVSHDAHATVRLCAKELMKLGLTNFAYVGHFGHQFWSDERKRAFESVIHLHGLHLDSFAPTAPMPELAFRKKLQTFLRDVPKPCGILAANDEIGEIVIVTATRLALDIPSELAVISIDNNPSVCESLKPTLSSVEVDFYRAGQISVDLLARLAKGKCRHATTEGFGPIHVVHRASTRTIFDHAAAAMVEHIRKNALTPLHAGEVARLAGGCRRNAEKRFRKATGRSIMDEIHAIRMAKAKELLTHSSYAIPEIANACGYASEAYFRTLFKATTGLSPLTFRKCRRP